MNNRGMNSGRETKSGRGELTSEEWEWGI